MAYKSRLIAKLPIITVLIVLAAASPAAPIMATNINWCVSYILKLFASV